MGASKEIDGEHSCSFGTAPTFLLSRVLHSMDAPGSSRLSLRPGDDVPGSLNALEVKKRLA